MSDTASEVTFLVYRNLKEFANSDTPFTAKEMREQLGYGEESSEARRMHAVIQARKKDGIISVVTTARKRHQTLQVCQNKKKDLERLMGMALNKKARNTSGYSKTSTKFNVGTPATPKRVIYLEDRVERLEKAETGRKQNLNQLVAELDALKQEVHRLVEMWS